MALFDLAEKEREKLKKGGIPKHVAIIMDGNGRWAQRKALPRKAGHAAGVSALRRTIEEAVRLGVRYLSVYTFSTENWKRPQEEIEYLFNLFQDSLAKELPALKKNRIAVRFLGRLDEFSDDMRRKMQKAEDETNAEDNVITVNIMINYGSRAEIIDGINKLLAENKGSIKEDQFRQYLYTKDLPDPELLIRTSGELRVSNFLLWQIAYSEMFITKKMWPEFDSRELRKALGSYQTRNIRKGGL